MTTLMDYYAKRHAIRGDYAAGTHPIHRIMATEAMQRFVADWAALPGLPQ